MKKILAIMLLATMLFSVSAAPISAAGNDTAAEGQTLRFGGDGSFKILVIADIQEGASLSKYTLELIERALDEEQPDLVVLGGDNLFGRLLSLQTERGVKKGIDAFIKPIVLRGLPFCLVFGNHDEEAALDNSEQLAYFMSFAGCLAEEGTVSGAGNYNVTVKSSDGGRDVVNLFFLDSGSYAPKGEGKYAYVQRDQIEWYEETSREVSEANGGTVPAYLFQHIPVPEIYDALLAVEKGTEGAVRGNYIWSDSYYILNPETSVGTLGEAPCPPEKNNGQFASWEKTGDIVAAFFGHDHVNDFATSYRGIDLIHTAGTGFSAYGSGYKHGVRVIELNESAPADYETRMVYFDQLTDTKIPAHLQRMGSYVFGIIIVAVVLVIVVAALILVIRRVRRRRRARG